VKTLSTESLTSLSLDELDQLETAISQESSNTWDLICWELEPAKKSELVNKMTELAEKLQAVYAARFDVYGRCNK
jgi:uncharacterized lipoprotein